MSSEELLKYYKKIFYVVLRLEQHPEIKKELFLCYEKIAFDTSNSIEVRGDAFSQMGLFIEFEPGLDLVYSTGIRYYIEALKIGYHSYGCLRNICAFFGEEYPDHQEIMWTEIAIRKLLNDYQKDLSEKDLEMIEKKKKIIEKMEQEAAEKMKETPPWHIG